MDDEWAHIIGDQTSQKEDIVLVDTNELISGRLIRIDEELNDTDKTWKLLPIFRDNMHGGTSVWQIGFDEYNCELIIVHGTIITSKGIPGIIQTTKSKIKTNNSGRNIQQQAILQARKKYIDKWKDGYKPPGESLPPKFNNCIPMLAQKYIPKFDINDKLTSNITRFPVSTMPKIDGIRCLIKKVGPTITTPNVDNTVDINVNVQSRSRKNTIWPHLHHIKDELSNFFMYLPENTELDGELCIQNLPFTELTSIVKTFKHKLHKDHNKLKYYIFDIIESDKRTWEDRYILLVNALYKYLEDGYTNNTFTILQSYTANSDSEILEQHKKFINDGYEGIMIRKYAGTNPTDKDIKDSQYKPNRSTNLLKYKEFIDEEAEVIGGVPCEGNEEGAIKFIIRDIRGNEIMIRPRGSIQIRKKWMNDIFKLIGSFVTIRYQELSEHNVPRFPVIVCVRDYE